MKKLKTVLLVSFMAMASQATLAVAPRPFCEIPGAGTTISSNWCILTQAGADSVNNHYPNSTYIAEIGQSQLGSFNQNPDLICSTAELAVCGLQP